MNILRKVCLMCRVNSLAYIYMYVYAVIVINLYVYVHLYNILPTYTCMRWHLMPPKYLKL